MEFFESLDSTFVNDLFNSLESIHPKVESSEDLWVNDEVLLHVSSDKGQFLFSRDIWGFGFIMAENNQACILAINEILMKSQDFRKEEVDFDKYKNINS